MKASPNYPEVRFAAVLRQDGGESWDNGFGMNYFSWAVGWLMAARCAAWGARRASGGSTRFALEAGLSLEDTGAFTGSREALPRNNHTGANVRKGGEGVACDTRTRGLRFLQSLLLS